MAVNISILNATGKLDKYILLLENKIQYSLGKIRDFFTIDNIDITVTPFRKGDESPSGIGGYSLSPHRVELLLDCDRDDLDEVIKNELTAVLAHEIHHSIRTGLGIDSETLGQQLITEGMACHFEMAVNGGRIPSLFDNLKGYDWRILLELMKPLLNEKHHSVNKYFLGSDPDIFPKYAGYWVGFNLIQLYINKYQTSEYELACMESERFYNI
ncbi:MAG: hypothetical protein JXL81_10625 [Deltaproteobacteria bacterium]|nr:hypothetical protein [Deltaproteobacteria bacterium]